MRPVSQCSTCGHPLLGANTRNGRMLKNLYWVSAHDNSEKHDDGSKHKADPTLGGIYNDRRG